MSNPNPTTDRLDHGKNIPGPVGQFWGETWADYQLYLDATLPPSPLDPPKPKRATKEDGPDAGPIACENFLRFTDPAAVQAGFNPRASSPQNPQNRSGGRKPPVSAAPPKTNPENTAPASTPGTTGVPPVGSTGVPPMGTTGVPPVGSTGVSPVPASSQDSPKPKPRCTKAQARLRREAVAEMLRLNYAPHRIAWKMKECFGIGRRQTQLYTKQVKVTKADAAKREDYLAHLQLSNEQRQEVYYRCLKLFDDKLDPKTQVQMMRLQLQCLNQQDKNMEKIVDHRTFVKRDESPDGEQERNKRNHLLIINADEFHLRLDNWNDHKKWEWAIEYEKEDYERQLRRRA